MAGRGPAPRAERHRRASPARGDWKPSPDGGWQHELPEPPAGVLPGTAAVWETWFKAWWAGNWTPDDLPGLRLLIRVYDRVARGDIRRLGELRQLMDAYGVTPKGQQDRRWERPKPPQKPWSSRGRFEHLRASDNPYAHLRATDDDLAVTRSRVTLGESASDYRRPSAAERFKELQARGRSSDPDDPT